MRTGMRPVAFLLPTLLATAPASAHPGSGIVVDRQGQVYFTDTGAGVWKVDRQGRLARHPGPAFHWMAIDHRGGLASRDMPRGTGGELPIVGPDPTLILSSDFPVAVGSDGTLCYPQADGDRVRVMRQAPGGTPSALALLPSIREVGPDGQSVPAPWVHGLAAGPDGSLYYAERDAIRKVAADGTVSTVAANVAVPGCERPPAVEDDRIGPGLRGLAVAPDGAVYVAASGCKAVLKVGPRGDVAVVLRSEASWTPTGVALAGDDVYVLEYWFVKSERREDWLPRVRLLSRGGEARVVVSVQREGRAAAP